ncbi:MAG: hypothetical protein KGL31_12940 [candidate division NC10 bacterium]|nr:hypothetical protein [candidate division NC10 bacterium]MDE2322794.1 hypothetical protein [candidate division NC10 bacterium]
MRLFSYKLTDDTGFAPNPFFGVLTLATCKPGIRKAKRCGDWIAGFTSQSLNGDGVGNERLIFLMQITDIIEQYEYFGLHDFQAKIPDLVRPECRYRAGDNIYRPLTNHPQGPDDFEQVRNPNHWNPTDDCEDRDHKIKDLSGRRVLVSSNFYYFGGKPREVPLEARPTIPSGQARYGFMTHDEARARAFVEWVHGRFRSGVAAAPHKWPPNDPSWENG